MLRDCAFPLEGEHRLHHMIQYCVRKVDVTLGAKNDIIIVSKVSTIIDGIDMNRLSRQFLLTLVRTPL
jgi:hypothetical protein